jgi:hypothetical protein
MLRLHEGAEIITVAKADPANALDVLGTDLSPHIGDIS